MSEFQNNSQNGRISQSEFRDDALKNIEKLNGFDQEKQKEQNEFPIEVFPSILQEIVRATNEFLNFPIDFMGSSILYAASLGIGNTHRIKIKDSWIENAALFLVLVGKSGVTKSHPLTFSIEPIFQKDQENFQEFINLLEKWNLLNSYTTLPDKNLR